jgi:hypothetical protein
LQAHGVICLVTLAALYGLRAAGVPVEVAFTRHTADWAIWFLLLPYEIIGALVLVLSAILTHEPMMNEVCPRLYLGRQPFPWERRQLAEAGIGAILSLCIELPEWIGRRIAIGIHFTRIPILDGMPPMEHQFQDTVQWIARHREQGHTILVHCAQGHGRSSTIVAAGLCRLGLAAEVDEAIAQIRKYRPAAHPSGDQEQALRRFLERGGPRMIRAREES